VLLVDAWLHERQPASDLAGTLRCAWCGDLGAMRTPLPDECFDLVWVNDGALWLSGPETTSWSRGYPPGSNAVGIRFRPAVGPAVLGVTASDVRDARVRLDAIRPSREVRDLADRIAEQADDAGRMREMEPAARRLAVNARPPDGVSVAVACEMDRQPRAPLRDLARRLGLSERQIHRRCSAAFGYGSAMLARMLRVQRVLRLARSPRRPHCLADLAAAAGYCDQQHLAHEVRAIFGMKASALFSVQTSDPCKTRHPEAADDREVMEPTGEVGRAS
jgi:AraC-like DNA-binding protein